MSVCEALRRLRRLDCRRSRAGMFVHLRTTPWHVRKTSSASRLESARDNDYPVTRLSQGAIHVFRKEIQKKSPSSEEKTRGLMSCGYRSVGNTALPCIADEDGGAGARYANASPSTSPCVLHISSLTEPRLLHACPAPRAPPPMTVGTTKPG